MTYQDEMLAALATFLVEGRELLEEMETGLLGLEETGTDLGETVNAVFRAAHTIKGSSGLFGLDHMVRFTHVVESVLDRVRAEEIPVTTDLVGALLPCRDHLGALMDSLADGILDESPDQAAQGARLLAALHPFLDDAASMHDVGAAGAREAGETGDHGADAPVWDGVGYGMTGPDGGARRVHLSLRFGSDCLRNGMDPLSFIRYLSTLGEVVALTTVTGLLPEAAVLDPECCYLDFEVTLATDAPLDAVEGVFDFVRDESDIRVLEAGCPIADHVELVQSFGPLAGGIAQILVETGAVEAGALRKALADGGSEALGAGGTSGEASAPPASVPATVGRQAGAPALESTEAAPAWSGPERRSGGSDRRRAGGPDRREGGTDQQAGARGAEAKVAQGKSIRIEAPRLDRLIDVVGELVIAGASAGLQASHNRDEALTVALGEVMRLVEEVRDSALQLRMVPIGTTFSRFQRVVRDVSADLGKDIVLIISGGDTEVDKALVEQIGDPLMHLVRNSMDHGIESADVRVARGKPARGTLRLNAFHDSGSIVIEVTDDGGGIDADRVLAKAIERGLVEPGTSLSEQEVYGLLFEPGFSTAAAVSDLSGRGVGMDVVKRNVTALRGTIDVESRLGEGTTMRIRLPLTLAIIDGFLVGVGGATFVIPLDRVIECVELPATAVSKECMDLRGEVLPFIRLRSLFAVNGERPRRENVVVVQYAGAKVGLVVDSLMGEFQTVIKPLGRLFSHVQGIGGSTILGNGDVALIIDVPMLVRHHGDRHAAQLVTA
jgi:two-component system chemotaxis sensor kinase CheA